MNVNIMKIFIIWHNLFINYTFGWLFDSVLRLENMEIAHHSMMARVVLLLTLPILWTEVMLILTKAKPGRSTLIKVKRVLIWHPSISFYSFSSKCWSISFHPHRDEFIPGGYTRVWSLFGTGTHTCKNGCDVSVSRL